MYHIIDKDGKFKEHVLRWSNNICEQKYIKGDD